jgi:small subunit ribosomal protein S6
MPLYEHTVIARPDLSNQQAQDLSAVFSEVITAQGGLVGKVEYWGLRNLAYRVKKHRKGHYLHLNLDAPAAAVAELERTQRIHEDVLRYLTVRVEKLEEGASQVMIAKASRDERGPRRDFDGPRGGRDRDRDRGDRPDRPDREPRP